MKFKHRASFLALVISAGFLGTALSQIHPEFGLPIVLVHGYGSSKGTGELLHKKLFSMVLRKDSSGLGQTWDSRIHSVDYSSGLKSAFTGFEKIRVAACRILLRHFDKWGLGTGFILIGSSQGGMISRSLISECDPKVTSNVRRLFLIGTPNMGVSKVPFLMAGSGFEFLMGNWVDQRIYSKFLVDNFAASSYFKSNSKEKTLVS